MTKRLLALAAAAALCSAGAHADEVLDWNATMRDVFQANIDRSNPGWATRAMAMTNGALYDISQAYTPDYQQFQHHGAAPAGSSQDAAMAQAAYNVLAAAYPDQLATLDAALSAKLAAIPSSAAKTAGIAFGAQVAQTYISWRANDHAGDSVQYMPTNTPGHWQPDPVHPAQQAWGPEWGAVSSFGITSSLQFTLPGPPAMNSQAYADSFNMVKAIGVVNSATRTAEQSDIAIFWAYDRQGMGPPPVMFGQNLSEIATQKGNTQEQNARLFAMASVALADAGVAAWDAKFQYDFWRPITAIRQGDLDGNALTAADPNWTPLGAPGPDPSTTADDFTPPFPGYPSGHATFAGASFEILKLFYGTDAATFTLSSAESMPSGLATRSFTSFSQAELEAALSRVYMGVHWDFEATDATMLGNQIADYDFANYFQAVPEPGAACMMGLPAIAALRRRRR